MLFPISLYSTTLCDVPSVEYRKVVDKKFIHTQRSKCVHCTYTAW